MQKQRPSAVSLGLGLVLAGLMAAPLAGAQASKQRPPAKGATKAPAPATPPAPAGAMPQIAAAGIRVTGLGLGTNGTELKPFNESPGTTVALSIQAPKGSGIVDIDDHGSKLDVFSDDKGASLLEEGRVGPFPKISEDGSAALVELEVRARPSTGAGAIVAQGTIAMTLAGGSKPMRAANVKIDANQTFKIGATTLTISEPKVEDESTRFTVNLPRSLLTTIRQVRFFDAKNAPIEGDRRGSGYFNEKAQLELEVKTKDKAFSIEFEVWQNLRTVKAPFKVEAGLGFAAGPRSGGSDGASAAPDQGAKAAPPEKKPEGPPPAVGPTEGAESVEAVVKQLQTAGLAAKGAQVLSVIYPTERTEFAQGVTMAMAFMPMGLMDKPAEGEALQKELDAFFNKHNLKPPFAREADDLFKGVDVNAYVSDALAFMKSKVKKGENPAESLPLPQGKPTDVKITGDKAVATMNGKEINFSKIGNRWFIRLK
jgi:hypothetical protein